MFYFKFCGHSTLFTQSDDGSFTILQQVILYLVDLLSYFYHMCTYVLFP